MPGIETAAETARRLAVLTDRLEPLLVYAWRRHLSATVARMLADADPESYGLTKMRSVGFADLVNFTALVRRMSERDLARLVVQLLEDGTPGTFNAVGPAEPVTLRGLAAACAEAAGTTVEVVPVDAAALEPGPRATAVAVPPAPSRRIKRVATPVTVR